MVIIQRQRKLRDYQTAKRLEFQWKSIDWNKAEIYVNRSQVRIAKATQDKKWNTVKRLQYLLTHSYYAKALAVRKVTTNKGKNTSGIDKELWSTPASKMRGVLSLTDKNYKAKPLRRIFIEKKGKKAKRPLGIPCMYDRAMQALYALALDPVSEVTADTKSFGFRKGRAVRMPVNIFSQHYQEDTVRNGCLKAISRGVLTTSATNGSLKIFLWISRC